MGKTFVTIYGSEFALGLYTGLGIGLGCLWLLHRRVKSLWGRSG
jgi:hypothetical protein